MPKLLFLLLTASALCTSAQVKTLKIEKEKPPVPKFYSQGTLDLYYGNRIYLNSCYDQLNTVERASLSNKHAIRASSVLATDLNRIKPLQVSDPPML